ncbi:cadherin-like beta sandwich domain-containing protein [Paenibacillus sp. PDC88]|uniref:cadherin-like beta sandwich domain-containing protein n=1 Tax=Paenibacillus TaxID=44249 RepID=UPI00089AC7CC|nr:cadherin-like beta sandwich domain-containing protein [Paenibacillus sp. PDC88]SDX82876.1 Immune inhibitor A peptidase M6 [Paenibacillus sp. PDC88]
MGMIANGRHRINLMRSALNLLTVVVVALAALIVMPKESDAATVGELMNLTEQVRNEYDAASVGTASGQYMAGAKEELLPVLELAETVGNDPGAVESEVNDAFDRLTAAYQWFNSKRYADRLVYSDHFNAPSSDFAVSGGNPSWEFGIPASGPGSAKTGQYVWATNLSGNYGDMENSFLSSPAIDLSGLTNDFTVSWWMWADIEKDYDFFHVKVSKDGEELNAQTPSYYTFTGTTPGWIRASVKLDSSYAASDFRIHFQFTSDGINTMNGVYLDDLSISGVDFAEFDETLEEARRKVSTAREGNGAGFYAPGSIAALAGAIQEAESLRERSVLAPYEIHQGDASLRQKIAEFEASFHRPTPLITFDFEDNDGGFAAAEGIWVWGEPQTEGPAEANSGVNVWGTRLGESEGSFGYYGSLESGHIDARIPMVPAKLELSWMQWTNLPGCCGVVGVHVSKDGGATWQTVHEFSAMGPGLVSILSYDADHANTEAGWERLAVEIDPSYAVDNLQVKFDVGWGEVVGPNYSFYIDDVQISAYPRDLGSVILQTERLIDSVDEGDGYGLYPFGAKEALQTALDDAIRVWTQIGATLDMLASARTELESVLQSMHMKNPGPLPHGIAKGTIVQLGGKKWVVLDPSRGQLILDESEVRMLGSRTWGESKPFDPFTAGTLADYLNSEFLNGLSDRYMIVPYYWDVRDNHGMAADGFGRVESYVGLLTDKEYLRHSARGGDGTLHYNDWDEAAGTGNWWLITPYSSPYGGNGMSFVNEFGFVDSIPYSYMAERSFALRPVIYVKPGLVKVSGSGTLNESYELASNELLALHVFNSESAPVDLSPAFSPAGSLFEATVTNDVYRVRIVPVPMDPEAAVSMKVNGMLLNHAQDVRLSTGITTIELTVAAAGTPRTYTLKVTREGADNGSIRSIDYQGNPLAKTGTAFRLDVPAAVTMAELDLNLADPGSIVTVTGATYSSSGNRYIFHGLKYGLTTVHLTVEKPNGDLQNYTVEMNRMTDFDGDRRVDVRDLAQAAKQKIDYDGDGAFTANDIALMLDQVEPYFLNTTSPPPALR